MRTKLIFLLGLVVLAITAGGCSQFPRTSTGVSTSECKAWKVKSGAKQFDYFQYYNNQGRIVSLSYDENADGVPDARIDLAKVQSDPSCPHYVILLDGIPYDLIAQMYQQGHFRLFYPPSKVVAPFPSMTDVAYTEMFMPGKLLGFEAKYYDRANHCLSDGNAVYLAAGNDPWSKRLQYRVPRLFDAVGYVSPDFVFDHELAAIEKMMNRCQSGTAMGYSVGTSNVGTRQGRQGFEKCLLAVDRLCEKIMYERKGRCCFTLISDHGHNLTAAQYFDVAGALKSQGHHVVKKLSEPGDVVVVDFGLVTSSAVYTDTPADLAEVLVNYYGQVDLAVYPQTIAGFRKIVVRSKEGLAYVSRSGEGYRYDVQKGDPLKLLPIIKKLRKAGKVNAKGIIDDRALFDATIDHEYPDPLARVWRAFDGMVKYPPDLEISLKDGYFSGDASFSRTINVESTHGSLNRINSLTFVMTTYEPLPPAMRSEQVLGLLKDPSLKRQ
jgi:hypothetical protein